MCLLRSTTTRTAPRALGAQPSQAYACTNASTGLVTLLAPSMAAICIRRSETLRTVFFGVGQEVESPMSLGSQRTGSGFRLGFRADLNQKKKKSQPWIKSAKSTNLQVLCAAIRPPRGLFPPLNAKQVPAKQELVCRNHQVQHI